ncbi:MAG: C39 family peptidase [Polyangia bacterium]
MRLKRQLTLGLIGLGALAAAASVAALGLMRPAPVPSPAAAVSAPASPPGSFVAAAAAGASTRLAALAPALFPVLLGDVPHEEQLPDFCGEACATMWLRKLGHGGDQRWLYDQSGLDPSEGRGVYAQELLQALTRIGFRTGPGWNAVPTGASAVPRLEALFRELHADLVRGVPSIVCMRYDEAPDTTEHFRLILGYDPARDEVLYHEPAAARGAYQRMPRARFLSLWPLYDRSDPEAEGIVVRLRLEGTPTPRAAAAPPGARTPADYAQHVHALKARLPRGFHVRVMPPFVVLWDSDDPAMARSAELSVSWSVTQLKSLYFPDDPDEIINVWLFKDEDSYNRHLKELFREEPDTPYGYYSPRHRALFMNIETGLGTLVHEIVHPFMHKNFPAAPAWFNEGLGSLYEQCDERDGRIIGRTNWRLEGLQRAIRAGRLPSFRSLTAASRDDFYSGRRAATGYGQARYLLYYLQEQGLLQTYYRRFHAAQEQDPTGLVTLQKVLGLRDEGELAGFQRRWETWVLGLEFSP